MMVTPLDISKRLRKPKSELGLTNAESKLSSAVVIRKDTPVELADFKNYEFFFPLVVTDNGWIDIVGTYDDVKGIVFGFRTSFRPCYDGPVLTKRLSEALGVLNAGKDIFADAT